MAKVAKPENKYRIEVFTLSEVIHVVAVGIRFVAEFFLIIGDKIRIGRE